MVTEVQKPDKQAGGYLDSALGGPIAEGKNNWRFNVRRPDHRFDLDPSRKVLSIKVKLSRVSSERNLTRLTTIAIRC